MSAPNDWVKIKNEYLSQGTPYRELCEKYGVNLKTLARHAKKEGWVQTRKETANKVSTRSQKRIEDNKVRNVDRLFAATDKLLKKAEQLLELEDPLSPRDLKALSGTLMDARALMGADKDEDDRAEQKARIEKMRAEVQERREENRKVEVVFVQPPWENADETGID